MNIEWGALVRVAITTVVAAVAIIGIFSLGVYALTTGTAAQDDTPQATNGTAAIRPSAGAKIAGYACLAIAGLLVLYGLYLIIPQFH